MKEVLGQKYGLNVRKLKRRQTVQYKGDQSDRKLIDERRTFFCSELVAKAFKVLGIVKNSNVSCSRFMPGDFSAKSNFLDPTEGTIIGEEQNVIVNHGPSNEFQFCDQENEWDAKLDEAMNKY